jgi:hypothetical protein
MRDGVMSDEEGDALILAFAAEEERFMASMKEISLRAIEALDRTEERPGRGRKP